MPRLISYNDQVHEFPDGTTDEVIAKALKDKEAVNTAVSGYKPPAPTLGEKLVNWWQEGAKQPQPQEYNPRRYPQRGVWPFNR